MPCASARPQNDSSSYRNLGTADRITAAATAHLTGATSTTVDLSESPRSRAGIATKVWGSGAGQSTRTSAWSGGGAWLERRQLARAASAAADAALAAAATDAALAAAALEEYDAAAPGSGPDSSRHTDSAEESEDSDAHMRAGLSLGLPDGATDSDDESCLTSVPSSSDEAEADECGRGGRGGEGRGGEMGAHVHRRLFVEGGEGGTLTGREGRAGGGCEGKEGRIASGSPCSVVEQRNNKLTAHLSGTTSKLSSAAVDEQPPNKQQWLRFITYNSRGERYMLERVVVEFAGVNLTARTSTRGYPHSHDAAADADSMGGTQRQPDEADQAVKTGDADGVEGMGIKGTAEGGARDVGDAGDAGGVATGAGEAAGPVDDGASLSVASTGGAGPAEVVETAETLGEVQSTPLCVSAFGGNVEAVLEMIKSGTDINQELVDGETPLSMAILGGRADITELLVAHGADVNQKVRLEDGDTEQRCPAGFGVWCFF